MNSWQKQIDWCEDSQTAELNTIFEQLNAEHKYIVMEQAKIMLFLQDHSPEGATPS